MSITRSQRQSLFNQQKVLEVYHSGFEYESFEYDVYDDEGILPEEDGKFVYEINNTSDDLYYYWNNNDELRDNTDEYNAVFPGFDLNHPDEHKLYSYARFLIRDRGKFHDTRVLLEEYKIRELNSHGSSPGVSGYTVM